MFKFFKKVLSFLKLLFGNVDEWVKNHVQPSIEFVQRVKDLLNNPVTDVITALIPGSIDDAIKAKLLVGCNKALSVLAITADIANETDPVQQILKLLEYLKTATPAMQSAIYKQLASEMAKISAGGKEIVRGHSVDLLTQLQYSKMIEGKEAHEIPDNESDEDNEENNDTSVEQNNEESVEDRVAYLEKHLSYHA